MSTPNAFYTSIATYGDRILHRGYVDGKRLQQEVVFQPKLYVPDAAGKMKSESGVQYKTLSGLRLGEISPGTMHECYEFVKTYKEVDGFDIYGNTGWVYQYIASLYPQFEEAHHDPKVLRVGMIDIETECENGFPDVESANERINVITIKQNSKKWVLALGKFTLPEADHTDARCFETEEAMLADFLEIWQELDLDVISGWNIRFFDIPYLIRRIWNVLGVDEVRKLSPWNNASTTIKFKNLLRENEVEKWQTTYKIFEICGVAILDYYELYRKYTFTPRESFRLDFIAEAELGKKKMDYSEYDGIKDFYTRNFQKFVEYNVVDVELVEELDKKLNLIDLHVSMAYVAKINYEDVFSQVRTWDGIIYHYLMAHGIMIPQKEINDKDTAYAGAYVKDPIVGVHDWVISYDLASLYPHLLMQFNLSPETIVDSPGIIFNTPITVDNLLSKSVDMTEVVANNYALAANGQMFSRETRGFIPVLMEKFYNGRKTAKKMATDYKKQAEKETDAGKIAELKKLVAKYDTLQMAYKITLNSAYGAIGNQYFRFYDIRIAEAVTLSGQLAIRWIQQELNKFINKTLKTEGMDYVIASDTDSVYLNMGPFVKAAFKNPQTTDKTKIVDTLDKFCKTVIDPFINKKYQELADYTNAYAQKMEMKREVIADRGLWTAKKRYALNVYDSEGVRYATPKLKIMGIEVQRSSTPKICRDTLKESIKIVLTKDEDTLVTYVAAFKEQFFKSTADEIAFPRSVNGMMDYADSQTIFKKGTPIAVKGALIHNHVVRREGLEKKYPIIGDGQKVKFIYLTVPNPAGDKVLSFGNKFPKELKLESYVDYDEQFTVAFLRPLEHILAPVGWKYEKVNTLDEFFA
jgi:DNA polymerase elongation subunit (family B)